jgi:hypothetical protein
MSLEYLEELEHQVDSGRDVYVCPGQGPNQWHISSSLEELRLKAVRAANAKRYPVSVYRLVNKMETLPNDSFLVVRKIVPGSGRSAEPMMQWILVDTREAAEMLRDVSFGPSPYFGAAVAEVHKPDPLEKGEE